MWNRKFYVSVEWSGYGITVFFVKFNIKVKRREKTFSLIEKQRSSSMQEIIDGKTVNSREESIQND